MNGDFKFCYKYEGEIIDMYIDGNTLGYVAIGVTDTLQDPMKNSDMV